MHHLGYQAAINLPVTARERPGESSLAKQWSEGHQLPLCNSPLSRQRFRTMGTPGPQTSSSHSSDCFTSATRTNTCVRHLGLAPTSGPPSDLGPTQASDAVASDAVARGQSPCLVHLYFGKACLDLFLRRRILSSTCSVSWDPWGRQWMYMYRLQLNGCECSLPSPSREAPTNAW